LALEALKTAALIMLEIMLGNPLLTQALLPMVVTEDWLVAQVVLAVAVLVEPQDLLAVRVAQVLTMAVLPLVAVAVRQVMQAMVALVALSALHLPLVLEVAAVAVAVHLTARQVGVVLAC
jgi:hypothetical protein